jgi:hypothetical protein
MKRFFPELGKLDHVAAKDARFDDQRLIIGIDETDKPVAYPLEELIIPRHIINDTIVDKPILVSYCALCRSGIILDPVVEGTRLTFAVAGVWRRNMIMVDDQTSSVWQQATGDCLYGPYKGKSLSLIASTQTTWGAWKKQHLKTVFGQEPSGTKKAPFQYDSLHNLLGFVTNTVTMPGRSKRIREMNPRETVFGIQIAAASKAYPLSILMKLNEITFTDTIGSTPIILSFDKQTEVLTAINQKTQAKLPVEKHWWLGWVEFHPESRIFSLSYTTHNKP